MFAFLTLKCKVIFLNSTFSGGLVGAPVQCAVYSISPNLALVYYISLTQHHLVYYNSPAQHNLVYYISLIQHHLVYFIHPNLGSTPIFHHAVNTMAKLATLLPLPLTPGLLSKPVFWGTHLGSLWCGYITMYFLNFIFSNGFLADLGKARGCSTNSSAINLSINLLIPFLPLL